MLVSLELVTEDYQGRPMKCAHFSFSQISLKEPYQAILWFCTTSGQPVLCTECLRGHPSPPRSTEAITFSHESES